MKKKAIKQLVSLAAVGTMLIGSLAGCGADEKANVQSSEPSSSTAKVESSSNVEATEPEEAHDPVTLQYYIAGFADQKDADMVYEEVNELIQSIYPWITVEFHISNIADYATHLALAQTSGEQIDIIGSFMTDYQTEMANGAYMDVTDYLVDYPGITSALPEFAYGWGVMNGRTYGFPNWQQCNYANYSMAVDKEMADKYELDVDYINELIQAEEFFNPEVYDVVYDFFTRAYADGATNLLCGVTGELTVQTRGYEKLTGPIYFAISDDECKLINIYETEQMKEYYAAAKKYKDAGFFPGDLQTNEAYNSSSNLRANDYWMFQFGGCSYVPNFPNLFLNRDNRDLYFMQTQLSEDQYYIGYSYAAGITAVSANSEYPEDALRVIELLYTNEELHNMMVYGLEDVHYTKNGDGTITSLEFSSGQANAESAFGMYKFSFGNSGLTWINQSFDQKMYDWAFKDMPEKAVPSKLIGFAPDTSGVSSILGQLNAVEAEYKNQLGYMTCEDWEKVYDEFIGKLNSAGINDVIAELQEQIDEFLASK